MHFLYSIFLILIIFPAQYAYSADDLSAFVGKRISSTRTVPDTAGITDKDIEKECGIKAGEVLSLQQVRGCIIHYYGKGIFKDVSIEAFQEESGVGLQIQFIPKMKVNDIKIKGNDYLSSKKIRPVVTVRKGEELSDDKIPVVRDNILKLYNRYGFFDASVEVVISQRRGGQSGDIVIKIKEGKKYKVAEITFTGDRVFDDEKLRPILKTDSGAYYDEAELNSGIGAISRYFIEKGYINVLIEKSELLIERDKEEVSVALSIEAGPRVEVIFEGAEAIAVDTLRKELLIWKERAYDTSVLDESVDRMAESYQQKGYYFASISHNVERPDERHVRILFKIKEGESVTIRDINFTGNSYFKDEILKEYVDIKEGSFLLDDILREDLKDLSVLYKSNGFLDVKITHQVSFNEDDKTLGIAINIEEGVQTRLSAIGVEGNSSFSRDDIYPTIKSRVGRPFNESQVVDDIYNIQSFYLQKGYIYAAVDLKSSFSPDKTDAHVDYMISESMPVYIGNIHITGNTFTKEAVVKRELLIKEGDLYSYEKILRSQRQLLKLGIFRDVRIEAVDPDVKEELKNLSVKVEEGYPGSVEFGVGYGDVERFRGMIEGGYKNLFGTGRRITLRAEGSSVEQKYSLSYKEPWVLGYQMDGRIDVVDLIENKRSFDRRTLGFSTGIDKSFSEYIKGALTYQYEDVKLSDVQPEAILTPEDTGKVEVATINPSLIIDRRDDPFNPSRGSLFSITFREAARVLGSKPQFAKITVQNSSYYSPLSKLVLAFSLRGGVAWNFGESNEVPIFERYFVGGRSTVRGYDQERLGIPGKTINYDGASWNATGGNMMLVMNGEARFPIFRGLGMVVFVDAGNVWRKVDEFNTSEIRATAGTGIRYNTPVGPLRLDVGCKLDREIGEDTCLPHFTLGHAF